MFLLSASLFAQDSGNLAWQFGKTSNARSEANAFLKTLPHEFQVAELDFDELQKELGKASKAGEAEKQEEALVLSLPNPEGTFSRYRIYENNVISPKVRDLYTINTYQGYAEDSPHVQIRCDLSPVGFRAFVYDGTNSYVIEPYLKNDRESHIVYKKENLPHEALKFTGVHQNRGQSDHKNRNFSRGIPSTLRSFKLAYVASGEYSKQFGDDPFSATTVLNSFASAVNLVNAIYERDLGITFILVSTAALVFEDHSTDPYDPFDDQEVLIGQNQTVCDDSLGNSNYDIGHLLVWANTGGLATAGTTCNDYKAEGFSGSDASFTNLIVDYSCHEIGHQLGAEHNFISQECEASEVGFRFEPGEGSSIMSYAGVCGDPASYQSISNPFFHSASINAMHTYVTNEAACAVTSTRGSGNSAAPTPNAQANITIPMQTPFVLVGSGSDANDPQNQLTFLWEQYDGAGAEAVGAPNCSSTNQPLFRYRDPSSDSFRIFPPLSEVLAGNNNGVTWEKLPCNARTINFNLIARDNNSNWGRTGNDQMVVTVANTGPFAITSPNGGEKWDEQSNQNILWTENGTAAHCPSVDILFSNDGGSTYTILASAVANDGMHGVVIPSDTTTTARILVQCSVGGTFRSSSTFFDLSDANFTVQMSALPIDLITFNVHAVKQDHVKIDWSTALEINSSHFEVERSRDGQNYQRIDLITGAGNSTEVLDYSTIDHSPYSGINYYRLKQVDNDGSFSYSPSKSIQFRGKEQGLEVFPNPIRDFITVKFPSSFDNPSMQLLDQLGRTILTQDLASQEIDVAHVPDGVYYLSVKTDQEKFTRKIIIAKY